MPRRYRVIIPGLPHHCTHRGNRRNETFKEADDYQIYLRLLWKYVQRYALRIWAYCLMPNHVHLIAVPCDETSLSETIQCVDGTYATLFNGLYDSTGHLWEGRFYSSVMDEAYLRNAVRYVERNPIRSGLVARAEDYRWSSAAAHCGIRSDRLLADDLPILGIVEDWSSWLAVPNLREHDEMIRQRTESGYPCGPDEFVIQLEQKLGRSIRPQKSGRKPKQLECDSTALLKFSN
jgi:REP-associated tyrosine transposase